MLVLSRYKYANLRIQEIIAREEIKNKILYESTHLDPKRKGTIGNSSHWVQKTKTQLIAVDVKS